MLDKSETRLRRIFFLPVTDGIAYWCGAYEGPFKLLFQYFDERGLVSFLAIPSLFGAIIGLGVAYSVLLCFPEDRNRKGTRVLIAGAVGGALFWGMRSLGMFYFVGLIVFALVLGLSSGDSIGTKLRSVIGMFLGGLLGIVINSDLLRNYSLGALALEGYLTNLGLLLGYQARVKLIWYAGLMGFLLASIATPFLLRPRSAYLEVVASTTLSGGIGYLLDRLLKKGINKETPAE